MTRILFAVLLSLAVASPAAADIAPPRIHRETPPLPAAVRVPLDEVAAALKKKDAAKAEAQVDARGWQANLVGGSGTTIRELVEQGSAKGWFPRVVAKRYGRLSAEVYKVTCDIVEVAGGKVVDRIHVLVVKVDGAWKILGAGEDDAEVLALGKRFIAGLPLAPAPEKEPVPE